MRRIGGVRTLVFCAASRWSSVVRSCGFPPGRVVGLRGAPGENPHPRPLSRCAGEGSVVVLVGVEGWRSGRGIGGGCGPLRCDREGHVVTGVCGRGRWLSQQRWPSLGCVGTCPCAPHHGRRQLNEIICSFSAFVKPWRPFRKICRGCCRACRPPGVLILLHVRFHEG